jgi:hypothetical protein
LFSSTATVSSCIPRSSIGGFQILTNIYYFPFYHHHYYFIAVIMGLKWWFIVLLICISLMTNDISIFYVFTGQMFMQILVFFFFFFFFLFVFFFFFFAVLEIKPRALCLLGKHCYTTELHLQPTPIFKWGY